MISRTWVTHMSGVDLRRGHIFFLFVVRVHVDNRQDAVKDGSAAGLEQVCRNSGYVRYGTVSCRMRMRRGLLQEAVEVRPNGWLKWYLYCLVDGVRHSHEPTVLLRVRILIGVEGEQR